MHGFTCGNELSSVTPARKDLMTAEFCRFRGISCACSVSAEDGSVHLNMTRPDEDFDIPGADSPAALTCCRCCLDVVNKCDVFRTSRWRSLKRVAAAGQQREAGLHRVMTCWQA